MLVQTLTHFSKELDEVEALVLDNRVCDWAEEFVPLWLNYMLFAKWFCRKLAIIRRRRDNNALAKALRQEYEDVRLSVPPAFAERMHRAAPQ